MREAAGPGWALVGDAGMKKDPVTAQGISTAFRCAEMLAEAADEGLSGRRPLDAALSAALNRLSDTERVCFVLKHVEQWRLSEIAEELDINVGRVKQALFRGVRKLRPNMTLLKSEAS